MDDVILVNVDEDMLEESRQPAIVVDGSSMISSARGSLVVVAEHIPSREEEFMERRTLEDVLVDTWEVSEPHALRANGRDESLVVDESAVLSREHFAVEVFMDKTTREDVVLDTLDTLSVPVLNVVGSLSNRTVVDPSADVPETDTSSEEVYMAEAMLPDALRTSLD